MNCLPCEDEDAATTSLSADAVRNGLIGVVVLLVLVLIFTGRRPPKHEPMSAEAEQDFHANLL